MWECIYSQRFGGRFKGFLCCHVWNIQVIWQKDNLRVERNKCVECGRGEYLLLVKHNKGF